MTDTSVIFNILAKDNASGVMGKVGGAAKGLMAAFAVGVGLDQMKDAIDKASNLAETQSKVNVIFGQGAGALNTWGAGADKALGQSQQQALDAASTFALYGKTAGLAGQDLVGFSTNLTRLASDMASFSNTSPQEAIDAIGAALRGENDPIEKYGVLLNEATIQQQALKMGLIKTTSQALTPQQRVLAAQAAILAQTGSAQGDFARTSGGLANQQRIMAAEFSNVKTKIGSELLPVMTQLATSTQATLGFIQRNSGWLTPLAIGLGILAGGIWAVDAAQTAWNVAMALSPIGLVIIAVIALVAAFIYLWNHSKAFRDFWIGLWNDIWGFLKAIGNWFAGPFAHFFVDAYHWVMNTAREFHDFVVSRWNALVGFVTGIPGRIRSAASGMWDGVKDAFRAAVNWLIGRWNSLHFTMPSFDFLGFHSPGFTLRVPAIPYLAAGGDVLTSGLAVIHAGERVVPTAQVRALPPGPPAAGGGMTMRFAGSTDSALATLLMNLVRTGLVQLLDSTGQPVTVT